MKIEHSAGKGQSNTDCLRFSHFQNLHCNIFRKIPWFVAEHKAVKLTVESRNNSYKSKQMCHSRYLAVKKKCFLS